ncbi:protein FAM114A2 [Pararge aegeria]|uniref:Jg25035 protein n=3 Tax=Pararge aegeria TaxID=116150 RepID=A0A8S4R9Q9_9NEOP|nr:protein FAM114A2 [Pararge aegeria]CAH2230577.1 jg25035 [Pararge aegeria aegeria]
MPSSDSEDFESADEGRISPNKRERKKRLSSSNYSDNLEDQDNKTTQEPVLHKVAASVKDNIPKDGWDDFDIEEESEPTDIPQKEEIKTAPTEKAQASIAQKIDSQKSGWDDFDDWGEEKDINTKDPQLIPKSQVQNVKEIPDPQEVTKSDGWGWGWGNSLLSTATAGISNLTTQVSQGISTVLETGIGAPDPEELARISAQNNAKENNADSERRNSTETKAEPNEANQSNANEGAFPFGSLLSGVTKFVETTGTKVLAGGLDTLETIGKKTMEVLQDGDPGLAKKRAMLGLDSGDKPVLSQVLREARAKADEEDQMKEAKREAKAVHYETLFDDFEGLVHLEALEMLSKQVSIRIEERLRSADPNKRQDIKETLQQVAELCEMPDEEDEEEDEISEGTSRPDALHERLQRATRDIGLKLQFQPLIKQFTETLAWLETSDVTITEKAVYKKAVSDLAQTTALSVELYHKTAEMLLVKNRRSTADEADALTQLTVVLTKHISDLATQFTEKLTNHASEDKEQINNYITNVFLEAGNSSKYIENAFHLALPIVQIGAV